MVVLRQPPQKGAQQKDADGFTDNPWVLPEKVHQQKVYKKAEVGAFFYFHGNLRGPTCPKK